MPHQFYAPPPVGQGLATTEREARRVIGNLYRARMEAFTRFAFKATNPGTPYLPNWHIDLMCEYLEACSRSEIRRLIINIPPRSLKSVTISVAWPAWLLGHDPSRRIMCASYSKSLSLKHSVDCRSVMQSATFRDVFPDCQLSRDQNEKTKFTTTQKGYRIATSTGAATTGEGGDFLIVDDPHNAMEAQSDVVRQGQIEWFDKAFSTRLDSKKSGVMVVVMQRLHENDLTGHLLELGGWVHLKIPIETERTITYKAPNFAHTFRAGTLLHPERMGRKEVEAEKVQLGMYGFSGQYMQNPTPPGGGIFQKDDFNLWPHDRPLPRLEYVVQSYDTAFTEKTEGDPTACTTWGIINTSDRDSAAKWAMVLLDAWDEHYNFPDLRHRAQEDYRVAYGVNERRVNTILIEKKGSGMSLIQELRTSGLPVLAYDPGRPDKVQRANAVAPYVEAGLVYIPESKNQPGEPISWARPFFNEVTKFPKSKHDDYTDTFTQAIKFLSAEGYLQLKAVDDNYKDVDPDEYIDPGERTYHNPYSV